MSLTLEGMRADIAGMLFMDPSELGDGDALPDLGLDSMRLMNLVLLWEEAGAKVDFATLAEFQTLGEWWRALGRPGAEADEAGGTDAGDGPDGQAAAGPGAGAGA